VGVGEGVGVAAVFREAAGDFPVAVAVPAVEAPVQAGNMRASEFLTQLQHDAIVKTIGEAESKVSGEIRVFISRKEPEDPVAAAQKAFHHLGMQKTRHRNGVLLFVAPRVRKFAIIGDSAVHQKCGDEFWKSVADEMSGYFRKGDFTDGLLHGIRRAGKLLEEHFPRAAGDKNQQSDDIAHD
jgi:uncharacterized membrane protein